MHFSAYPLRLTEQEREKLQLVIAALKVSEYTDDVDDFMRPYGKEGRMEAAIREFVDTVVGLSIASDAIPRSVKESLLASELQVSTVVPLLEELFEILRRHKRLNPFLHRGEFGKLMMMLQDVQKRSVQRALGIQSTLVIPVRTVGAALTEIGCAELAEDKEMRRRFLRAAGAEKQAGMRHFIDLYGNGDDAKKAVVEHCLRSIDDAYNFIQSNTMPLRALRRYIERDFEPLPSDNPYTVSIRHGRDGACFTHTHSTHCQYVMESLLLWENVQKHILELWEVAENDMLVDGRGQYVVTNTGQGFHRMCSAPQSCRAMSQLVQETEKRMGGWVGIKVIHLGDRDVPNPLVFIDKYTVIPHIVQPVVQTLRALRYVFHEEDEEDEGQPQLANEYSNYPGVRNLLRSKYHSYAELRMMILSDFFKHGFDGSGDDGGTCIDGRLTSAWNWCHQLNKKQYYDAFVLGGFSGFD
ncbi:hypothetical protein ABB37_03749 [Leptomonas pyrrhocoris]|uniref:Non-canonical E2 ubiquitin-conjugating enzyme C-terminal domain-containing protein n=1 Tax=Leptomonas pyrrhocoris TaxID=157538 RepID=A0A0M9G3G6_LEPPY|nr:hypothetical protein ABB37_03749 [Leptomonas pyrrhocoris]XP_015659805.1 hypothetical protein ABB37_03749 [Leptomonas pyrrhocoris]XP_015659806.1 hypothetical protein ABB37_03749 [Leptomonas pyrrhocoris]KPA81365.1 hypothetical protein ABB37_03749 [Leptomonas pyrrhocoris]KPA81366.1 hypothetical protein ABB37_03749 [Leptomonas pyrrhocoris]KPA81367.1 hypothetical protein ABB37_03749 [Leptomonas pyrrhocoris]|eukprot:XP_015659804.1 hypothetical protein ABB37_03749 [Leptomonas pyrrhocoris]